MGALGGMTEICDVDEETRVLVEQVGIRVGMLMEDASVEALVRALSSMTFTLK